MRKYLSLFLIVGVLLLAACSNNSEETNEEAASDDAATIETQKELEAMKVEEDKVVATVNDKKIKGIIMHSREKRPEELTPKIVFDAIVDLVDACEELGVTPKPEHKWPYSKNTLKHKRLVELTDVLGKKFNPFLLDCKLEELADLVL